MLGWENPLAVIGDAVKSGLGRVLLFGLACWAGCAVAVLAGTAQLPLGRSLFAVPVYWLVGIPYGFIDGWGVISYLMLFVLLATLIGRDTHTATPYLLATLVQAFESARLMAFRGWLRPWLFAILIALVFAGYAGLIALQRRTLWQRNRRRYRRNMGLCVACGYDLRATILAGGDACPECGEPIPRHTINVVRAMPPIDAPPGDNRPRA